MNRRRFLYWTAATAAGAHWSKNRVQAGEQEAVLRRLLEHAPALGEKSLGRSEAPVTVLEYASATCPHCANFHSHVWPRIKIDYVDTGKVRWIFREFPLDELAMAAFMLARCAPEERYFEVIAAFFEQQKSWAGSEGSARGELARIMSGFGMTKEAFDTCIQRRDLAEGIYMIAKTANVSFAVTSTPTFFIDGERITGTRDFTTFQGSLDAALGRKGR